MDKIKVAFARLISTLGVKRAATLGVSVLLAVGALTYIYVIRDRSLTGADTLLTTVDVVTNSANLSYTDSQDRQQEITSNVVETRITDAPTEASFTFAHEGWYLMGVAKQPTDRKASSVFGYDVEGGVPTNIEIDNRLQAWNIIEQANKIWGIWTAGDELLPEVFGEIETGKGYWLELAPEDVGKSITIEGTESTDTKVIDLNIMDRPGYVDISGWALLANPFNKAINFGDDTGMTNVFFEKNGEFKTYAQASTGENPWIDGYSFWWDQTVGGLQSVSCADHWPNTTILEPWHGFWLHIFDESNGLKMHIKYNASTTWQ